MTSFKLNISAKDRTTGRFIGAVTRALQQAFVDENAAGGLTQAELARKLGVDRSVVHRRLQGTENLTLRSIAELAWAMGRKPAFSLDRPTSGVGGNEATHADIQTMIITGPPAPNHPPDQSTTLNITIY